MLSLFFFLTSSLICLGSANLIRNHPVRTVDIIHDYLPMIKLPYASDVLVFIQIITTVFYVSIEEISEIFLILAFIQLLRAVCCVVTVLPPLKNFHDKMRFGGINGSGTEYIFSGHASYACVTFLYLWKIMDKRFLIIYNLLSQFLIVATKNHYSIDVLLAWIIVPLTYGNLQMCKEIEWCENRFLKWMV